MPRQGGGRPLKNAQHESIPNDSAGQPAREEQHVNDLSIGTVRIFPSRELAGRAPASWAPWARAEAGQREAALCERKRALAELVMLAQPRRAA